MSDSSLRVPVRSHLTSRWLAVVLSCSLLSSVACGDMIDGQGLQVDDPMTEDLSDESQADPASDQSSDIEDSKADDGEAEDDLPTTCEERVFTGDALVTRTADLGEFAGVTKIAGDLTIQVEGALGALDLHCLTVVTGNLTIRLAEPEVDDRGFDLRVLGQLTTVGGDLTIGSLTRGLVTLESLAGLEHLKKIGGHLSISGNTSLRDIDALAGLATVGGQLIISGNPVLRDLNGLTSLASAELLTIADNAELADIKGLARLESIRELKISSCPALPSLEGLYGVRELALLYVDNMATLADLEGLGNLTAVRGALRISQCPELQNLSGLEGLRHVQGDYGILDNASLRSIDALRPLQDIFAGARLRIAGNPRLHTVDGLWNLHAFAGSLEIVDNADLRSLEGLRGLTRVGALTLQSLPSVDHLSGLSNLKVVERELRIADNRGITDYSGLAGIDRIGVGLALVDQPELTSIDFLSGIEELGGLELVRVPRIVDLLAIAHLRRFAGKITLESLPGLVDLSDLAQAVTIAGNLRLVDLPQLRDIKSLAGLRQLGGLTIANNPELGDLEGLEGLHALTGEYAALCLHGNPSLTSIAALANIRSVQGPVSVTQNHALAALTGLDGLGEITGSMRIEDNPAVRTLAALARLETVGQSLWDHGEDCTGAIAGDIDPDHPSTRHSPLGMNISGMQLEDLAGLEALHMMVGALQISGNPALRSIESLRGSTVAGDSLIVEGNCQLRSCEDVVRLLDDGSINFAGPTLRVLNNLGPDLDDNCG